MVTKVVFGHCQLTFHQNRPDFGLQADLLSARLKHESFVHQKHFKSVPHDQHPRKPDEKANQATRYRLPSNRRPEKKEIAFEYEVNMQGKHSLGHEVQEKVHQVVGKRFLREMNAHDETHDQPQTLHVRRVHAIPDFALEVRDALLPRPQTGLPHEL